MQAQKLAAQQANHQKPPKMRNISEIHNPHEHDLLAENAAMHFQEPPRL